MNISSGDILFPLIRCSSLNLSSYRIQHFFFPGKLVIELKSDNHPPFLV